MTDADRKKAAAARLRLCFDNQLVHIRMGTWRSAEDTQVTLIAQSVWLLHGTVCTCCPRVGS